MPKLPFILFIYLFSSGVNALGQKPADSTIDRLQQIPVSYLTVIDKKADRYTSQVTSKTEKTLTNLSRWENKIHILLQKVNPASAERLFSTNQLTFTVMLQKLREGEAITNQYRTQYDGYRDKLTTDLKYLQSQKENINSKLIKPLENTGKKISILNEEEEKSDGLQQLIKDRKKQLIGESLQYIGKSKYLTKINKESWYYAESLRNYKEIFNDETKAETVAKGVLNQIPAFQQFVQKNSLLASLFGTNPMDMSGSGASLAGLQTRENVQSLIQDRIASGGPNVMQDVQQNILAAQSQINKLKSQIQSGSSSGQTDLPDFKPNLERTKTFSQRLEFGSNFQFGKSNYLLPSSANVGLKVGYKINSKSVAGIGASYNLGLGFVQRIVFSNQGISLRSFMDWKLKKQFFISGGMEMNYLAALPDNSITQPNITFGKWQEAALMGISKKISVKNKWVKSTQIQLLYDFLSHQHLPVSQPVVFRMGYNF